ncbi:MAG: EcoKI restriction-modification system protein HsdS [Candidatus Accumulibacter regalis]|uniref:EcoKI restriction-modification system protein HsdS n=1 Tax=Accumulibacter regalis TaxID=522306 RepID=A0A011P5C1_ACCRE|nr:restriction endonuclease subunit S [Accumulibacter sp.]EXI90133.1 MAG: EcoKI restriction-modification system protein HsdS [Candidatus Accumulibacter regalis]HRE72075.1 restriction endonuclease subunit S [Accumulibacter sp.]
MSASSIATAKLGDVADLNPPLTASLSDDEIVSFLPMSAVVAESADAVDRETRSYATVKKGYTAFVGGDVLVAKITPCFENGKIAHAHLTRDFGFGSTEFHVVRPRAGQLDARYLVHYLRQDSIRRQGESRMTGSAGQRRVPEPFVAGLDVPMLPLVEQRRIAAILDKADALRAKRRAALTHLDTLTQSIFLDMFGDPRLNSLAWSVKRLNQLGVVKTGGTPPTSKPGLFGGAVPFVTPADLAREGFVKRTVTEEGAAEAATVRAGASLVCCIGATIGKMGKAEHRSAFNQQINAVEWSDAVNDDFGLNVLRFFKPQIAAWGASTTLPILKKSSFEKLEIPIPPISLQSEFACRVKVVERLRRTHSASLTQLDALFASLQHRAFRGEL